MAVDSVPSVNADLKTKVYQVISKQRISSLHMIAQIINEDEERTRLALQDLIDDGSLSGELSADGRRFFMSDVKVSYAPVAHKHEDYVIKESDTKLGKTIFVCGILTMVAGYVMRGLAGIQPVMEHMGSGVLLIGIAILVAGWLQVSRSMPPEELRKH